MPHSAAAAATGERGEKRLVMKDGGGRGRGTQNEFVMDSPREKSCGCGGLWQEELYRHKKLLYVLHYAVATPSNPPAVIKSSLLPLDPGGRSRHHPQGSTDKDRISRPFKEPLIALQPSGLGIHCSSLTRGEIVCVKV